MFLIASAAYCSSELQSEFGLLPPAFLPLGNKRLFQHQISRVPAGKKIFLSLPDSYQVAEHDKAWLEAHHVTLLFLPEQLSLGESLVAALNLMDSSKSDDLTLLFGDTLLLDNPTQKNCLAISHVEDNYRWAVINHNHNEWVSESSTTSESSDNMVVNGYFNFSQPSALIKALISSRWNFIQGLNLYRQSVGLTEVKVNDWLDFGHVHTYFHSKAKFTTQRAFNELAITPEQVFKSGTNSKKIAAESNWFNSVPAPMRRFLPQLLGHGCDNGKHHYQLEYLHHTALNELFVFSELPVGIWKNILTSCFSFIDACQSHLSPKDAKHSALNSLFSEKTNSRLDDFCTKNALDRDKKWSFNGTKEYSINDLLRLSQRNLPNESHTTSVVHGDFCFSNILFDFRTSTIKTIDPRGLTSAGEISIYGDIQYDIAKLSHSVVGLYDWIIAGYYQLEHSNYRLNLELPSQDQHDKIQAIFYQLVKEKYQLGPHHLLAMQIQLFLSMLPLHDDDNTRQFALLANAFRLAQQLQGQQA